ncbi:peptidylprolyl isomerase [Phaeovulum sp.]|uniref:peptidylprolyl isomerase n=1 Tax=Phaeovulum sp. TaxID=2934796 RepID=UPI0039E68AE3
MRAILILSALLALIALPDASMAQGATRGAGGGNLFAPVIQVNDLGITGFELEQRKRFLAILRAPGDLDAEAEKALIEDRLRMDAAKRAGIKVTKEAITAGMEEFASRANLTTEELLKALSEAGIEPQTFRDFVEAGTAWREIVRTKFASRVNITPAEVDRALSLTSQRGRGTRVLLSEVIIPTPPGQEASAMATAQKISTLRGEAAFAEAARNNSAAGSRGEGGRLPWMPVENLPPALRTTVMGLAPGQATAPVTIPNAVAVFMLRAIDEAGPVSEIPQTVDYMTLLISGGRSEEALAEAAALRGKVDSCVDLFAAAKDYPPEQLVRETLPLAQIPQDIALELAHLDPGESSTALVRGNALVFVMLCSRDRVHGEDEPAPNRDEVFKQLQNARFNSYSESYMADLVADAVILRR